MGARASSEWRVRNRVPLNIGGFGKKESIHISNAMEAADAAAMMAHESTHSDQNKEGGIAHEWAKGVLDPAARQLQEEVKAKNKAARSAALKAFLAQKADVFAPAEIRGILVELYAAEKIRPSRPRSRRR
jgi:hypothetical protein